MALKQKYHNGDLVQIAEDLGTMMSHFTSNKRAVISHSYHDAYGGGGGGYKDYSLNIEDEGSNAWYEEHQLTLIEHGRYDLLEEWDDDPESDEGEE